MKDMTEREVLERAARAAGLEIARCRLDDVIFHDMLLAGDPWRYDGQPRGWNPITNKADLFELAEACKLTINFAAGCVMWACPDGIYTIGLPQDGTQEWCIVRACAEIDLMREKANG